MNRQLEEHNEFNYSTDAEWDREDARIRGEQNQDSPWVLSDRDVWHVNPYWGKYDDNGQPLMKDGTRCRHPEDYDEEPPIGWTE
jgi:hypothetical protein